MHCFFWFYEDFNFLKADTNDWKFFYGYFEVVDHFLFIFQDSLPIIMSHQLANEADYMEEEYEMDVADDDVSDEFHGRDAGGSDSEMDEYDYMVCS